MFALDFHPLANAWSQAALEVRTVALANEVVLLEVHEVACATTRLTLDKESEPLSFQRFYFQMGFGCACQEAGL